MSVIGSTCELAGLLDSLCVPCPRKGEKCFYAVLELCDCVGSLGGLGCSDSVLILMPWGLQAINLLCLHWMDITRPVHAVRLWVTPFFNPFSSSPSLDFGRSVLLKRGWEDSGYTGFIEVWPGSSAWC